MRLPRAVESDASEPTCRAVTSRRGLLEVRSALTQNRIARALFCIYQGQMVLLNDFIKKSQQTPVEELEGDRVPLLISGI